MVPFTELGTLKEALSWLQWERVEEENLVLCMLFLPGNGETQ